MRALPLDDATVAALDDLRKRQMAEGIAVEPAYRALGYVVIDELGAPTSGGSGCTRAGTPRCR